MEKVGLDPPSPARHPCHIRAEDEYQLVSLGGGVSHRTDRICRGNVDFYGGALTRARIPSYQVQPYTSE